jgi:hypothetical protein
MIKTQFQIQRNSEPCSTANHRKAWLAPKLLPMPAWALASDEHRNNNPNATPGEGGNAHSNSS